MPTSLRLTEDILERADRLVPLLADDPALVAGAVQVGRATVLRLALLRGLAELEREQGSLAESPAKPTRARKR